MDKQYKVIKDASGIVLPDSFKCPICGAKVVIDDMDEREQNDDGTWQVSECGLHITCETEPEIEDDAFDDWLNVHFSMPYVDWMPLEERVRAWINSHYRFEVH